MIVFTVIVAARMRLVNIPGSTSLQFDARLLMKKCVPANRTDTHFLILPDQRLAPLLPEITVLRMEES